MCNQFSYIEMAISALAGLLGAWVGARASARLQERQIKAQTLKKAYSQFFAATYNYADSHSVQDLAAVLAATERARFDCSKEAYACMCQVMNLAKTVKENDDPFFEEMEKLHRLADKDVGKYEIEK